MREIKIILCLFFCCRFASAQDSAKVKLLNHEIGVNVISLIRQVASNSPSNTLSQLPYDFFYHLYYKNIAGLRTGAGVSVLNTQTEIDGQQYPRVTNSMTYNLRFGGAYNIVKTRHIVLCGFADYIIGKTDLETSNTSTAQSFPNPIQTITTNTFDETLMNGFQLGAGVKFNFHKNLSLYLEVPYAITSERTRSELVVIDSGEEESSISSSQITRSKVYLPTTIYLVLRF